MSREPLINRIYASRLLWDLCKIIHYTGFPFRELAQRVKPLVELHGEKKVSLALLDIATHVGWRTMLHPTARKACFSVLGPAPEQWDWYYTDGLGNPTPRPPEHQTLPVIPLPQPDPILDSLTRFTATELDMKLRQCRAALKKKVPDHERQLCEETIPRVESEMVRRGQDVPPEEKEELKPAEKSPKATRTRKKKG